MRKKPQKGCIYMYYIVPYIFGIFPINWNIMVLEIRLVVITGEREGVVTRRVHEAVSKGMVIFYLLIWE